MTHEMFQVPGRVAYFTLSFFGVPISVAVFVRPLVITWHNIGALHYNTT